MYMCRFVNLALWADKICISVISRYTHLMGKDELPELVRDTLYRDGDLHYIFMGEIEDVFGTIDE